MQIKAQGKTISTAGMLPKVGSVAPQFTLVKPDLSNVQLKEFLGKNVILNIFVSVDTGVCAESIRKFNEAASKLNDVVVICISVDLPFAQKRFCATENLNNVFPASAFRNPEFGKNYGVTMMEGPLSHLLSRAIVIIDPQGKVIYTEQVPDVGNEPNYQAALEVLK